MEGTCQISKIKDNKNQILSIIGRDNILGDENFSES